MNTVRKLIALVPPPSKREQAMLEYRAKLMKESWDIVKPFARMKLTQLEIKHPDIEQRYRYLMYRVYLLNEEIEKEREARSIFEDVPQAVAPTA
jgi:hypothetical protein